MFEILHLDYYKEIFCRASIHIDQIDLGKAKS